MPRKRFMKLAIGASAVVMLGASINAQATLLNVSGSFSASNPFLAGGGSTAPTTLSGAWSFTFDDSVLSGAGVEEFDGIPLDSLTLTPNTIGSTNFSIANSVGYVGFIDGVLRNVWAGGLSSVDISAGTDDWAAVYTDPTSGFQIVNVYAVVAANPGISTYQQFSGSIRVSGVSTNPEPATFALFSIGLLTLVVKKTRKEQ